MICNQCGKSINCNHHQQGGSTMVWETSNTGTVSRNEAKRAIVDLAKEDGIKGAFKVFYNDVLMTTPDDLPTQVDMALVRISAVLDQA